MVQLVKYRDKYMNLQTYFRIKRAAMEAADSGNSPLLSKEEFLKQNPNKLERTWGEFLFNSPFADVTGTDSWLWGGYGNAHLKRRQEQADNEAYENYLRGGR